MNRARRASRLYNETCRPFRRGIALRQERDWLTARINAAEAETLQALECDRKAAQMGLPRDDLRVIAGELGLKGWGRMAKAELAEFVLGEIESRIDDLQPQEKAA